MLTDAELTRMAELEARATKGPWNLELSPDLIMPTAIFSGDVLVVRPDIEPHQELGDVPILAGARANFDFIAASRTFVPDAIAEIKRLREEVAAWQDKYERVNLQ